MSEVDIKTPGGRAGELTDTLRGLVNGSIQVISGSTLTLTDDHHGKMLAFTGTCTVTIPASLRDDFACGWSQDGSGQITFAVSGLTLQAYGGGTPKSAGQFALGGIQMWAGTDVVRLYGGLA